MWREPRPDLCLADDEIHVWRADLSVHPGMAELDAEERARAARLRFERDRQWFIAAHSALRRILAKYAGCNPGQVRFERTPLGKPYISGPVRFNMSHSGTFALYAISVGIEVGVDVERVRENVDVAAIADRFLPEPEAIELSGLEPDEQRRAFFRLWTRREAFLKARGIGLRGVSDEVGSSWFIEDLDPAPGYAGAVAWEGRHARVLGFSYLI